MYPGIKNTLAAVALAAASALPAYSADNTTAISNLSKGLSEIRVFYAERNLNNKGTAFPNDPSLYAQGLYSVQRMPQDRLQGGLPILERILGDRYTSFISNPVPFNTGGNNEREINASQWRDEVGNSKSGVIELKGEQANSAFYKICPSTKFMTEFAAKFENSCQYHTDRVNKGIAAREIPLIQLIHIQSKPTN